MRFNHICVSLKAFKIAALLNVVSRWENRNKAPIFHFLSLGIAGHLAVNILFTMFLLSISGTNYPGGTAISHLHRLAKDEPFVKVHISNLAAQTGVTRFTQINNNWTYSKTENLHPGSWETYQFTHLIAEAKSKFSTNLKPYAATHDIVDTIEAFHQLSFNYFTIPPVKIKTKPVLFILRRRDEYKELLQVSQESVEDEESHLPEEIGEKSDQVMDSAEYNTVGNESQAEDEAIAVEGFDETDSNETETSGEATVEESLKVEESEEKTKIVKTTKLEIGKIRSKEVVSKPVAPQLNLKEAEETDAEVPSKSVKSSEKKFAVKSSNKKQKESIGAAIVEQQPEPTKGPIKEIKPENSVLPKTRKREGAEKRAEALRKPAVQPPVLKQFKQVTSVALPRKHAESRQNVKQNIKKIIQEFKKEHEDFSARPKESVHAKDAIRKIIEEERTRRERDEISRIQRQIMDVIESNPNIMNKESIKSKLQDTIFDELVNAIDHKIHEKTDDVRRTGEPPKRAAEKSVDRQRASTMDLYESDEDYVPGEVDNAANLGDEDAKPNRPEEEKLAFLKRFKKANEKLDNILTIIDEIVDTIEITDEDDGSAF